MSISEPKRASYPTDCELNAHRDFITVLDVHNKASLSIPSISMHLALVENVLDYFLFLLEPRLVFICRAKALIGSRGGFQYDLCYTVKFRCLLSAGAHCIDCILPKSRSQEKGSRLLALVNC